MNMENLIIDRPSPGHYVISGHNPRRILDEDGATIAPPSYCYISPELPSAVLEMVLKERAEEAKASKAPKSPKAQNKPEPKPKPLDEGGDDLV